MTEQINNSDVIMGTAYTNPVPPGIPVRTRIERGEAYASPEIYTVEVTILETLRGPSAQEKIQPFEAQIGQPQPGYEFILVRLRINYSRRSRAAGGEPFIFSENQFSTFTIDGFRETPTPVINLPGQFLNGSQISPGGSQEGWLLLQVLQSDPQPLLVFKRQNVDAVHGVWGSIWYRLF